MFIQSPIGLLLGVMSVRVRVNAIANTVQIVRTLMTELDELAIKLVALDGHRMKLKNEERTEAIRLMVKYKVPSKIMAWRLCIHYETLRRHASRANIKLPNEVAPVHWTFNYVFAQTEERKEQLRADAARRARKYRGNRRKSSIETTDNVG